MANLEVFTDGSATTANKPGGWAYVLVFDGYKYSEGSGHVENVSNNDMELEASIQGLAAALKFINSSREANAETSQVSFDVTLCSDSQIVLGWCDGTYRFKQEHKMEKYKQLQFLAKRLNVKTRWIKGHSGHPMNERCDKLANLARKNVREDIDKLKPIGDTRIGTKKNGVRCLWYGDQLKVIDFEEGIIENYNRDIHGKRGSMIAIRKER